MIQVNILEAKTDFSKLIRQLETRKDDFIIVARNGKPVAKITLINETPVSRRIGTARVRLTRSITAQFLSGKCFLYSTKRYYGLGVMIRT